MNSKRKLLFSIIYLLLFFMIFTTLYTINKSYAKIRFDIHVIDSKVSLLIGQIYYSQTHVFHKNLSKYFILHNNKAEAFQTVSIPITHKNIHAIRLDPLPDEGEVIIKNFHITQGSWFNKKTQQINLNNINLSKLRNINLIQKENNLLHLKSIGPDPHLDITYNISTKNAPIDYEKLLIYFLFSFLIASILIAILYGLIKKSFTLSHVLTVTIILIYILYCVLYSNKQFVNWLFILLPIFGIYIILLQGIKNYIPYFKNILILLCALSLLVIGSDIANDSKQFLGYLSFLPYILISMLLSISFIQSKKFNKLFYQYTLYITTFIFALFILAMQYNIVEIDRIITYGHRMSMSNWTQKNYTFVYLFLLWGSISFLHFDLRYKKELFMIVLLLILSFIVIMQGYSDSAKLSFILSLMTYIIFNIFKIHSKLLLFIPLLVAIYIFFMPLIAQLIIYLSQVIFHDTSRENIYAITTALINEKPLLGYGYKTSSMILLNDYLPIEFLKNYNYTHIPGYNPHNIPLWIWLNFGVLGALFFSTIAYIGTKKAILLSMKNVNQPAIIALIFSFIIITTFSWSGWWGVTFLTYTFFVAIVLLSLNQKSENTL